jgi:transcriptional regulator with XRE-family HTH domain
MNTSKGFRIARVNKDVNQGVAAKGLGISANYLSLIETGDRTPSMKLLKRAQSYYNVAMSVLLHESEVQDA